MSRDELLKELYKDLCHNLYCYSTDRLMMKAKEGYEDSWAKEKEKIEIINELMEEEEENEFKVYYSMKRLYSGRNVNSNIDLAYLEDKKNLISCYLSIDEINNDGEIKYILTFSIHKKDQFEDEFDNIYVKELDKRFLKNRSLLKNKMKNELEIFKKYIKNNEIYIKYYPNEETEEFE